MSTQFLQNRNLGYLCELVGGPLDGQLFPLLFAGRPKHPTQLTELDQHLIPTKTNPDLFAEDPHNPRRPFKGEFILRQALYAFAGLKQVGDTVVPRFEFRRERDVRAPG